MSRRRRTEAIAISGDAYNVDVLQNGMVLTASCLQNVGQLWDREGTKVADLVGHRDVVLCGALIRHGECVATGSRDCTIRLWEEDAGSWGCIQVYDGHYHGMAPDEGFLRHTGHIECVAGVGVDELVSGSSDSSVCVWELGTGRCKQQLRQHSDAVLCIAVQGEDTIATGGDDMSIVLWRKVEGEWGMMHEIPLQGYLWGNTAGHRDSVRCLVFAGEHLVSGADDATVRIWHVADNQLEQAVEGHAAGVAALAVLGDGRVVSGCDDSTIRLWKPGNEIATRTMRRFLPTGQVQSFQRSFDKMVQCQQLTSSAGAIDCFALLEQMDPDELLLAATGHDMCSWRIPRQGQAVQVGTVPLGRLSTGVALGDRYADV
eukprot:TRINITY_DN60152_c0_g1_i2.p1 TRINITY_DN60152_c0_g1~~TRINITY_DN60152_c0_g1_i2.p1  ORF type:complete len:373 (-),score=69.88 TRINITY_DN60152_c0_g1_i2:51-1169(-)